MALLGPRIETRQLLLGSQEGGHRGGRRLVAEQCIARSARHISNTAKDFMRFYTYDVVRGGGHRGNVEYTGIDVTGVVVLSTVNGIGTPED